MTGAHMAPQQTLAEAEAMAVGAQGAPGSPITVFSLTCCH